MTKRLAPRGGGGSRALMVVHLWRCDHGHWSARCSCGKEAPIEWDTRLPAELWAKGHVGGAHRGRSPELHVIRDEAIGWWERDKGTRLAGDDPGPPVRRLT
jgi:hypothetical protein